MKNMLSLIIYSLERGYLPVIMVEGSTNKDNLWECFLQQPLNLDLSKTKDYKSVLCSRKDYVISPSFEDVYDKKQRNFWGTVISKFVVFNTKTRRYFDSEINNIIKDKSVVACVIRGTDYLSLKPKGHPKQPELCELFEKIQEVMKSTSADYVYLATEEEKYAEAFKLRFPGRVLENKRNYFDEKFKQLGDNSHISCVSFGRENDDYLKSLEYFSSINIVSKCNSLVTGLCGGSQIAVFMNQDRYELLYVFDKGYY